MIAFHQNHTPVEFRILDQDHPENGKNLAQRWPLTKFPVLVHGKRFLAEATIIIEYLAVYFPGPVALIPDDNDGAIEARMLDRFFDNYVMTPMQKLVSDALRRDGPRDAHGVGEARSMLDTAYAILDRWMTTRKWAAASQFSIADCAAAPALFYADWVHPIPDELTQARGYRARLLARPSIARARPL